MGDNTRPAIEREEIIKLHAEGHSYAEIGRRYGITRAAVSWAVRYRGGVTHDDVPQSPRQEANRFWPFSEATADQNGQYAARMLRAHSEWVTLGGKGSLSAQTTRKLVGFYQRLINGGLVVEFDPSIPPSDGVPEGGFRYVARRPSDRDLLIRVNEHTDLSVPGSYSQWRFPKFAPVGAEDLFREYWESK